MAFSLPRPHGCRSRGGNPMDRSVGAFLLLALLMQHAIRPVPARAAAARKPAIQKPRIDQTQSDEEISSFCGFPVDVHEIGTVRLFTFADGKAVVEVNEQSTFS